MIENLVRQDDVRTNANAIHMSFFLIFYLFSLFLDDEDKSISFTRRKNVYHHSTFFRIFIC